ncbi:type VII secretion integral membrane protein EccD [Streptomyces carpaticus]|uniref:type VII secretion integral membrane protein EccD n=1 Tax=Streptomyces TaxID=1883 RepID=UPI00220B0D56|nr:type VII secretion integral membrane protein EccD [Streptomyces carpaticus]
MVSRVTLVGDRRRIDLVLPAEDPIGELLPEVLRMLGERPGRTPALRRLVTPDGSVLAQDDTLASAGVPDGAVLRLVREQETPAAPVVHDVTDEVAEDLELRRGRWDASVRALSAGGFALALVLTAVALATLWYGADRVGGWVVLAAVVAAAGSGPAIWFRARELGTALILLGGTLGIYGALVTTWSEGNALRLAAVGAAVVVSLALLGALTPLGRGGLVGAGAVALLIGVWELGAALAGGARTGVLLGVISVLALGFLPRFAMMAAGLTRLDDQRSGGVSVSRYRVDTALSATHRGLALATVATAASAAAGGWLAVGEVTGWTVAVTALLGLVLLSRARAFPLAVEVIALLAAGAVLVVRLIVLWAQTPGQSAAWPLVVLGALAVAPLALLVARPPDHVRVRLRRLTNGVESVAVVALVPVALGAFGVYGRLLGTF